MALHLSARLAWHMDGWNGHICQRPADNTYCVGQYSYPGEMIREQRDLDWEQDHAGVSCTKLDGIPPCIYSMNAFGSEQLEAFADPPAFFNDQTETRHWDLPPATVCLWPYEEMYMDEVKRENGTYNYDLRLQKAKEYFSKIDIDRSLIFYYSNYSNPFSEEEQRKYVVVGVSRVKKVGDIIYYKNCSAETKRKYGGGFIWDCNVTSHYPDEGFRIPYHRFLDNPDVLAKITLFPENPRNFKFGTRLFTDDEALTIIERLIEIVGTLREVGDTSEDWSIRVAWLQSLVAELWVSRGLYPGLPRVLEHLEFHKAISYFKLEVEHNREQAAYEAIFAFLNGKTKSVSGLQVTPEEVKKVSRQWLLKEAHEQNLLQNVLCRFDLQADQIKRIMGENRQGYGIAASLSDIADNPYILCEQYIGD